MQGQLPNTVKYIYGYIRKSRQDIEREKRVDQDTLAEQRTLIEDLLETNFRHIDWDIYEEIGSGGDLIESRPVFSSIIEEIKAKEPRTVAIAIKEISRLGRGDYSQMGIVWDLLMEKHLYLITPGKIYDPYNSYDQKVIKFNMFMANMEYDMIKERMVEARAHYARMGRWMTGGAGIPYGYKFNSYTQKLEPDPDTAWVVQKIFHLYVNEGIGYNAISTRLSREGIPTATGKDYWKPMVIRRILVNPVYVGTVQFRTTRTHKGTKIKQDKKDWIVVENAHEPIIDKETFEKAGQKMKENRSSPKVKLEFEPTPLASLIVCSKCGNKMQRQYSTQYYTKKDGTKSCYRKEFMICLGCSVYMKYNSVEEEVLRILEEDFINVNPETLKEKLKEIIDIEKMQQNKKIDPLNRISVLEKQLQDLDGELTALRRMLRKGQISDEEYEQDRAEILRQKEDKERQLNFLRKETQAEQVEELDVETLQAGFKDILHLYRYGELSKGEKNELLRGIFDYIVLEKTGKGKFNLHAYLNPMLIINSTSSLN
ncbi:Site-specific DNA recombinase [Aneurinibacillus thermoaerophilus]|uniref:Site-specific DNA recombinase n=1 Tax=Aneurinibacillus thermoaerophilus TaxID=143495 RepID=A0A1G7WNQ9_ANETH|nr:recombinase family protein [Aneurinibacillus thermoaerophilus]SDG73539.1 Site-specific DNA recombinase [Aneurinibacillus thermoaerophilus]